MKIVDFTVSQIEQAARIAKQNYETERTQVSALPPVDAVPDLTPYSQNSLGVAAYKGGNMLGFLCCVTPFKNAFGSTNAAGVFSPMGANGAIGDNRAEVYARMYQAAGEKWARAGAVSHAVCLYAHDKEAQEQFFRYGFGLRCIDAVRGLDEIAAPVCEGCEFTELTYDEYPLILPLNRQLGDHMEKSPVFMQYPFLTDAVLLERITQGDSRFFAAKIREDIIAYVKIADEGENFACGAADMQNICGAYCLPEYRGKGIYQNLINFLTSTLKNEKYTRLGVDFESFNPTALGFWLKYFEASTHSVVRRIDENAVS